MVRRSVIAGACVALRRQVASAQSLSEGRFPEFPSELAGYEQLAELAAPTTGYDLPGTLEPDPEAFSVVDELIRRAPFNCRPVDVANYFHDIGQGFIPDLGDAGLNARVGPHCVRAWPVQ